MKKPLLNLRQFRLLAVSFLFINSAFTALAADRSVVAAVPEAMFSVNTAPSITDFNPKSSPITSTVTIDGTDFISVTDVRFDNLSATSYSVNSANQITVTVPVGAKIGKITVITSSGSATTTSDFTPYVVWVGGSGNWDTESNWGGTPPDQNTNVVINSGAPVISGMAVCNNITIATGAGLNLQAGADLTITGIFSNLGNYTQTGGKITFAAPIGLQQIPALTYNDVMISGSGTKQLLGNTTVNGTLTISNSNLTTLDPANNTLTLKGSLANEGNTHRYIGKLVKTQSITGSTSNNFGNIGLNFNNTGNGDWGTVTVTRVTGESIKNPADNQDEGISRHWNITTTQTPGTAVNLTLSWLDAETNGLTFPEGKAQIWKSSNNGASWQRVDAPKAFTSLNGLNSINTTTTSFSKWTVSDQNNPLPVSWLYFNGRSTETGTALNWATATEKNTEAYVVERSENGREFTAIGKVKAAGNSSQEETYNFTDKDMPAAAKTYYRLKQTDQDGTFAYSKVIAVAKNNRYGKLEASVYPNPFSETINLHLTSQETIKQLSLTTIDGKEVYSKTILSPNNLTLTDLPALPAGIYLLKVMGEVNTATLKVVRQ